MARPVQAVQFTVLSSEEIMAGSVLEVTTSQLWSGNGPQPGGLLDPRLGAVSADIRCATCDGVLCSPDVIAYALGPPEPGTAECPGHFGHISLPLPVFVLATMDRAHRILSSFCVFCGDILAAGQQRNACAARLREFGARVQALARVEAGEGGGFIDAVLRLLAAACTPSSSDKHAVCPSCSRTQPRFHMRKTAPQDRYSTVPGAWFPLTAVWPCGSECTAETPADVHSATVVVTAVRAEAALDTAKLHLLVTHFGLPSAATLRGELTLRAIPVPPPCMRPSEIRRKAKKFSSGGASHSATEVREHAMTKKLRDVLKTVSKLDAALRMSSPPAPVRLDRLWRPAAGLNNPHVMEAYAELQFLVNYTHDAKHAGPPPATMPAQRYGSAEAVAASPASIVSGKTGLMRQNIMGKRSNYTARTVIGPEPNAPFGCLAVPRAIAETVTIPERVTPLNFAELTREAVAVLQSHASTRSVFSVLGRCQRDLSSNPYDPLRHGPLAFGQIVERRLRDGDIVMLNRQPTLHGPSMQAVRIIVQDFRKTLGFCLPMTKPFNADFDGDEMNVFVPQSLAARAECETLMLTQQQLLLPATGAPCMGLTQDDLLAAWLMSRRDQFFDRAEAMDLLLHATGAGTRGVPTAAADMRLVQPAVLRPRQLWTGKQLLSAVLPDLLTLERGSDLVRDKAVIIRRGQLLVGRLSKSTVGASRGSLQHVLATHAGLAADPVTRNHTIGALFDGLGFVCREFMMLRGFSIGLADVGLLCQASRGGGRVCGRCEDCRQDQANAATAIQLTEDVATLVQKRGSSTKAAAADSRVHTRMHPDVAADRALSDLEAAIVHAQERARDQAGEDTQRMMRARQWRRPNAVLDMLDAGSKGNPSTLAQMAAMVGGQVIKGARVVNADICTGPAPPPLVTTLTGEPDRTLGGRTLAWPRFRALPHMLRMYPGACEGGFVQQSFVGGLDPMAFWFHAEGGRQGLIDTASNTAVSGAVQRSMVKGLEDLTVRYDGTVRNCNGRIIQPVYGLSPSRAERKPFPPATWPDDTLQDQLHWPDATLAAAPTAAARAALAMERTAVTDALATMKLLLARENGGQCEITVYTTGDIVALLTELAHGQCTERDIMAPWDAAQRSAAFFASLATQRLVPDHMHALEARIWLCSRQLVHRWCMPADGVALREVFVRLERMFASALAVPGDGVGVLAATSMGEPTTQMTLNSFHHSGTTAAKIGGIDRCLELVYATKTIKTPIVRTYAAAAAGAPSYVLEDQLRAIVPLQQRLRTTLLGSLVQATTIDYQPLLPRGTPERPYLHPQDAPLDELERFAFEHAMQGSPPAPGHIDDDDADWMQPACVGRDRCRWRVLGYDGCAGSFVLTLHLDSRWFMETDTSTLQLEEALRDGACGGNFIVHVGEPDATGTTPLRIRARLCRAFETDNTYDRGRLDQLDEVEKLHAVVAMTRGVRLAGPPNTPAASITKTELHHLHGPDTDKDDTEDDTTTAVELGLDVATNDLQYVLSEPGVDQRRTTTNDVHEALRVMGVEAARAVLLRELEDMIASGSCYVDRHHPALLADAMTSTGRYTGFMYNGMRALRHDPLLLASFQQAAVTLTRAARNYERVPVISPAAAICLGQPVPWLGTSAFDVILDTEAVQTATELPEIMYDDGAGTEQHNRHRHRHRMSPKPAAASPPPSPWSGAFGTPEPQFSPVAAPHAESRVRSYLELTALAAAQVDSEYASSKAFYSPSSPTYSPSSPTYSPSSPTYSPSSPTYSPTSPAYSATSPSYSPSSPSYSPVSPAYSATSPLYSPTSPLSSHSSANLLSAYSPSSPSYSPVSPAYSPVARPSPSLIDEDEAKAAAGQRGEYDELLDVYGEDADADADAGGEDYAYWDSDDNEFAPDW